MAGEVARGFLDIEVRVGDSIKTVRQLTTEINAFQLSLNSANQKQADFAKKYTSAIKDIANQSSVFTAQVTKIASAAQVMDKTLSKGQATLGQFFSAKFNKNGAIAAEVLGLARERVSALNTQVVATTRSMNGLQEVVKVKKLAEFSEASLVAAQRQQVLSTMLKQGTTNLINFGKNVQWAGRQLMVGFTVPLTIFGNVAGKTFMDLEKQVVAFKKVYGDVFTTPAELQTNLKAVTELGREYTKYGIAVKDTIGLAAQAAAAGRKNADLTDAVAQATRLATLGQMDQNAALETTISLQSAFKLSGKELADSINFLNMVENQTVVSLQDLSAAIPRVAPVIVGLGGDVKDLAVFLAAMQEGGVDAAEGANALKSGLASLINPTKQATQMLSGFGINLDAIIQANKGDLMGTVMAFSQALQGLDQFSRQQALEQVFGKFQYAKLGALFENISRQGSQAQQVIATMGYSTEQLGATADKELKAIEQSFGVQLTGAIERFKLAIAPIGEIFVKNAIPIVNFFAKLAEGFNNLSDGKKQFIAVATAIVGIVIPAATMMLGLFMNLTGTLTKFVTGFGMFAKSLLSGNVRKAFQDLGGGAKYLSLSEIDAAVAAQQLSQASQAVSNSFQKQIAETDILTLAVNRLAGAFGGLSLAQARAFSSNPELFGAAMGASSAAKNIKTGGAGFRLKRNRGGPIVPGSGNTDSVPAMLTPGEFVVNKEATRNNYGLLQGINSGNIQGFNLGGLARRIFMPKPSIKMSGRSNIVQAMDLDNVLPQSKRSYSTTTSSGSKLDDLVNKLLAKNTFTKVDKKVWDPSEISAISLAENELINDLFIRANKPNVKEAKRRILSRILDSNIPTQDKEQILETLLNEKNIKDIGLHKKFINILDEAFKGGDFDGLSSGLTAKILGTIHLGKSRTSMGKTFKNVNPFLTTKTVYRDASGKIDRSRPSSWTADIAEQSFYSGFSSKSDVENAANQVFLNLLSSGVSEGEAKRLANLAVFGIKKSKHTPTGFTRPGFSAAHNAGGPIVPGSGNTDSVPAMLTPGEFVVNKEATKNNAGILNAINSGKVKKFGIGGLVGQMILPTLGYQAGSMLSGGNELAGMAGMTAGGILPALFEMRKQTDNATKGLSGVGRILPKLINPVGLTVGAFAALGFGLYKLNKSLEEQSKASIELVGAMYGSADRVKAMGEAFGRESNAASAIRMAVEKASGQYISQEAQQSSSQVMQSDAGKGMIQDVKSMKAAGENAAQGMARQLALDIVAGVITTEEARAIAIDLGKEFKDQKLAVGISGELTKIVGPNGEDITKNISGIVAKIAPQMDKAKIVKDAEEAYKNMGFFEKFGQGLMRGGMQGYIDEQVVGKTSEANASAFTAEAEALTALDAAYQAGTISSKEYQKQQVLVKEATKKTVDLNARALGYGSVEQMLGVAGKKKEAPSTGYITPTSVEYTPGGGTATITPQAVAVDPQVDKFVAQQKDKVRTMLQENGDLTSETVDKMMKDFEKLDNTGWYKLASGEWSGNLDLVLKFTNQGMTTEEVDKLISDVKILQGIPGIETIIDLNAPDPKKAEDLVKSYQKFEEMKNVEKNVYIKDNFSDNAKKFGLDYQKILDMPDSTTKTAIMLKVEALANLQIDWDTLMSAGGAAGGSENADLRKTVTNKVKTLVDSIGQMQTQLGLGGTDTSGSGGGAATDWLKYLQNRFDLVDKRLSLEAQKFQDVISLQERQNTLDQRNIELNNRGLDQLSKEEDALNKRYNERISLLDGVAESNNRLKEQESSRIDLAKALAEGNVSTAAQIMGQMTANEANYRIEDTRAALEKQREEDLKNLKVEVNGQLLTREQIQSNIDAIEEQIYQRNILIQDQQDRIYAIEQERLANTREREKVETRLFLLEQRKAIIALQGKKATKGLSAEERTDLKTYKDSYNEMAAYFNTMFGENVPQVKMFGGKIKKFAMGSVVPGKGNSDRVPALLTPGEFVVRKSAAQSFMPLLQMINDGVFPNLSGPSYDVPNNGVGTASSPISNSSVMYNDTYNINVNVAGTNASPDDIANVVMSKLSQTNRGNIRSIRY